jgi:hypothetical protein
MLIKNDITLPNFTLKNGPIYYQQDGKDRLYMPQSMEKEVFYNAHDRQAHAGFHRTFKRITETLYFHNLAKRLRRYVRKCPTCLTHQTTRHAPYKQLIPIVPPALPFHTIAIDFIMALPELQKMNTIMSITDKFTKRLTMVPGNNK